MLRSGPMHDRLRLLSSPFGGLGYTLRLVRSRAQAFVRGSILGSEGGALGGCAYQLSRDTIAFCASLLWERCSLLLRTPRPVLSPKRQAPAPPALRVSLTHRAIPRATPQRLVLKLSLSHPIAPIRRSRRLIRHPKPPSYARQRRSTRQEARPWRRRIDNF